MKLKTHLAIGIFAMLLFLPIVNSQILFSVMVIVGSLLPDIDTPFSSVGKYKLAKVTQVLTRHRGALHSLTFCFLGSLALAVFVPVLAFGFFLGYSLHLITDSFTKMGVSPFWPYKKSARGVLVTGGMSEKVIFIVFVIIDFVLAGVMLFR
ncbi:MAG: metal-dependent hydrolase [Nanoarchaeota archaeon]|nr:metal-dependent hydrolase [Nanoarchaeota archaeon]